MISIEQLNGRPPAGYRWRPDGRATTLRPADDNWMTTRQAASCLFISPRSLSNNAVLMRDSGVRNRSRSMATESTRGAGAEWYAEDVLKILVIMRSCRMRPQPSIKVFGALHRREI